jgi:hypothetical protein
MKKVSFIAVALVAVSLLAAPLALGQGGNPPASTKESGQTSGKGMTAGEQTGESVEQQIKTLSDQLAQALLKGDTSFSRNTLPMITRESTLPANRTRRLRVSSPVLSSTSPLTCAR